MEVIHGDLVCEIRDREAHRHVGAILPPEKFVGAHTDIEYVPRRYARGIVIVVGCTFQGYSQPRSAEIGVARRDAVIRCGRLPATKETDRRLLGRAECERIRKACDVARNKSAIVAPGERAPRTVFLPLIT